MRLNGRIHRKQNGILNFKEDMKKNKMRHYETLIDGMFPQVFPQGENGGETKTKKNVDSPQQGHGIEPQHPTLDEIWEWLGNPDTY